MSLIAAAPTADPLASLLPLHEDGLSDAVRAVLGRHHPVAATSLASVRALGEEAEPLACVTCLDGTLNLLLEDDAFAAALRAMAARVGPGGLVAFDVDTASRHAWRLKETWVVEDPETYICWEGKGADEGDARLGCCDVYAFVNRGPAWQRTDHRIRRRLWADGEVRAAATAAGLEVVARHGLGQKATLHDVCDDQRHRQAVYVLRRPAA